MENLEVEVNESENNNERYIRKDVKGGYIYNKSEIDYYSELQSIDVIDNALFGDYVKNGTYVLDKEVIDQLVAMAKVYQYSFGSNMFCQSAQPVDKFGNVDFAIKIVKDMPQKGDSTAILELLESIDRANGYYINTNSAEIAKYTAKETNTFVIDALKYFNVFSKKDEGLIKKIKTENLDALISRKRYVDTLKQVVSPYLEGQYKILYDKKMKALAKSQFGKTITEKMDAEAYKINGWFIKEDVAGYYKYLNQVLDSILEQHSEELLNDVKLKATLNKLNEDFAKNLRNIQEQKKEALLSSAELKNDAVLYTNMQSEYKKEQDRKQQKIEKAPAPKQSQPKEEKKFEKPTVKHEEPKKEEKPVEKPVQRPEEKPKGEKPKEQDGRVFNTFMGLHGGLSELAPEKADEQQLTKPQEKPAKADEHQHAKPQEKQTKTDDEELGL